MDGKTLQCQGEWDGGRPYGLVDRVQRLIPAPWPECLGARRRRWAPSVRLGPLGCLYRDSGRFTEAEPLFRRCLEIMEKTRTNHPDPVLVLEDYAVLLDHVGRGEEATALRERGHAIRPRC